MRLRQNEAIQSGFLTPSSVNLSIGSGLATDFAQRIDPTKPRYFARPTIGRIRLATRHPEATCRKRVNQSAPRQQNRAYEHFFGRKPSQRPNSASYASIRAHFASAI